MLVQVSDAMPCSPCCPRCVLISADDAETPFASHPEIVIDGGIATWTPAASPFSASGFRVTIGGMQLDHAAITVKPVASGVDEEPFRLHWSLVDGPELLYLGEVAIAAAPAVGAVATVAKIEIGFGWYPYAAGPVAVAWFLAYDAAGALIRDIRVPLPLDIYYLSWRLASVEASDTATLFVIEDIGGPAAPGCPPSPPAACDSFRTGVETDSNYIVRGLSLANPYTQPVANYYISRLRAEIVYRTANAAAIDARIFFGDCCAAWQFELLLQTSVPAVYLRFTCAHGGPILDATLPLTGAQFLNTPEPVDYVFGACIQQEKSTDGINVWYQTRVGVIVRDSNGAIFTPSATGPWGIVPDVPCAFDANGLVPHFPIAAVMGAFFPVGAPMIQTAFDACPCSVGTFGLRNECLDDICLGGHYYSGSPPATAPEWRLSFAALPGEFGFAARPEADGPSRDLACGSVTTTTTTSAEGNQYDPQNVARADWITQALDGFISQRLGLPRPTYEIYCESPCWGASMTGGPGLPNLFLAARVWKPLIHVSYYADIAAIPLFVFVTARKVMSVTTADGKEATALQETTAILGGVSAYPNCSTPITFQFLDQRTKTKCWVLADVECPEMPAPPDFSLTTAELTSVS